MSAKKLNKFVELSKKLVDFNDYRAEERKAFVSNAIAIYRSNDLGNALITPSVARYFLFLVDPRKELSA